jgi:hypothetical protein
MYLADLFDTTPVTIIRRLRSRGIVIRTEWRRGKKSAFAPYDAQIRKMAKEGNSLATVVRELRKYPGLEKLTRQALHNYTKHADEPKVVWNASRRSKKPYLSSYTE